MGDLTKDLSRYEFACKCGKCDFDTVDYELAMTLQEIRDYWEKPVVITSGCRCPEYNKTIGSAKSKHMSGTAADFYVPGISPAKMYDWLDHRYYTKFGIGNGKTFTHLDIRKHKARWAY